MLEHGRSAAASIAADRSPRRSDVADAEAARAVQAGAAMTLCEMAAWRLDAALAEPAACARLAASLEVALAPRHLAAAASHLRWLISCLSGSAAPTTEVPRSPAAACVGLFAMLSRRLEPDPAVSDLDRGAWAVLRSLAGAQGLKSSVADLARLHKVAPARIVGALGELAAAKRVIVDPPLEGSAATVQLTPGGARLAESDPLGAAISRAQEGLDEEGLWRLVQLGGALLRI